MALIHSVQALVAVGGRAKRLREGGVLVPETKSLMRVGSRPLLYWCLYSLHLAGVRRIVLAYDEERLKAAVRGVVDQLPVRFGDVDLFPDEGRGVHGLPWQAAEHLDETFIFECGHSLMTPLHYRRLVGAKTAGNIVMTSFASHPSNRRQPIHFDMDGRVALGSDGGLVGRALAHPFVVDQRYAARLPDLRFNISNIISYYAGNDGISCVSSDERMPPEFDLADEFRDSAEVYARYLEASSMRSRHRGAHALAAGPIARVQTWLDRQSRRVSRP